MLYVLSLGTNIGNLKENLDTAIDSLSRTPQTEVVKVSKYYKTDPVGYLDQDKFLNCCVLLKSALEPHEILGVCLGIEAGMGRIRKFKNGPRLIDLDIIFAEDKIINSKNLTVPHPRWRERDFVKIPLADLFPEKNAFGFEF